MGYVYYYFFTLFLGKKVSIFFNLLSQGNSSILAVLWPDQHFFFYMFFSISKIDYLYDIKVIICSALYD